MEDLLEEKKRSSISFGAAAVAKIADTISVMYIDDEGDNNHAPKPNKGKNVVVSPPKSKATPWVEKYHSQSLNDIAAHRDILETMPQDFVTFD